MVGGGLWVLLIILFGEGYVLGLLMVEVLFSLEGVVCLLLGV